jgi:glycine oxidase
LKRSNHSEAEPAAPLPAGADVAVVGGGLAGLLGAWRAAAAGADAVVLDAPTRPAAASVAAGMIAPVGEASWGEARLLRAGVAAADLWPGFAEALEAAAGAPVPYRRCGALHVALDRDEAAELRRRFALYSRYSLDAAELLGSECRRLEPGLTPAVSAGISVSGEAEVDPRALVAALRRAARAAGARLFEAEASSIDPVSGVVATKAGERLEAARVMLAAGAWAGLPGLLPDDLRPPIRPVKGEILRLRADPGAMPCERIVVGERFYLVPRSSGEVVLGATVLERGFDTSLTAGGVHELLREAYRALPELAELELVEGAAGLRPGSPDNAPIFGPLGEEGRVLLAGGLYRNGVLLAPLLAAGFDAALADADPPAELTPFAPEQVAAGTVTGGSR